MSATAVVLALAACSRSSTPPAGVAAAAANFTASDLRTLLREGIATRAYAIEVPSVIQSRLDSMPLGILDHTSDSSAHRRALWSLFFKGSLMKMNGHSQQRMFYYNPMVDVAVVLSCSRAATGSGIACQSLCAMPGESLSGEKPQRRPAWISADDPLPQIERITSARMAAIDRGERLVTDATNLAGAQRQYCRPADQAIAETRLLDQLSVMSDVDTSHMKHAAALYIANAASKAAATSPRGDLALSLLLHPNELSISGVVPFGGEGWLMFYTPKANGWRQAALYVHRDAQGTLNIRGARALNFSSVLTPIG